MGTRLNTILIICVTTLLIIGGLYYLNDVLLPFIFGAVMAYFLDPATDKLEEYKIPRVVAASILITFSLTILLMLSLFIFPIFLKQFWQLVQILPNFHDWLLSFSKTWWETFFGEKLLLTNAMQSIRDGVQENLGTVLGGVFTSSIALVKFITNTLITIFVAFYLLLDWDRLVEFVAKLIPLRHKKTWDLLFSEIDKVLANFFRGQIIVCAVLALYYGITLMFIGLDTGLVIGFFAGLISFIPFVGAILGGGLALLVSLVQFWNTPTLIILVLAVFMIGQVLEGNFLTPKLVGKSIGIHPVWLIFSLTFFGSIAGFTGLLFAVPIMAILGVLMRHYLKEYFSSKFYRSEGS